MYTSTFQLEPEHGVRCWTIIRGVVLGNIEYKLDNVWLICPSTYLSITTVDNGTRIENISTKYLELKVHFSV